MPINARQLEVFRAVMRTGSLTAAARMLNVSQPATSKVLRHMESQLGYDLFVRVGGKLIPTAEAHLLFPDSDRVFREIEAVREFAARIKSSKTGLLSIGASAPPTFSVLPDAIAAFRKQVGSEVKIRVLTLPAQQLNDMIALGAIDLGFSMAPSLNDLVKSELLQTTRIVAAMHPESPLTALESVGPKDFEGQSLISYASQSEPGAMLDRAFEAEGLARRVSIEVTLSITSLPLVQAGLGVALVDAMFPWESFPGVIVRPFEPAMIMGMHALTSPDRPLQRLAQQFMSCFRRALKQSDLPRPS